MKRKLKKLSDNELHLKAHNEVHTGMLAGFRAMTAAKVVPKSWMERFTINLKGGVWVGLFTFLMLAGCINTMFLDGKDIPEGVRWIYATVLGAFAGTRITSKLMNGKNGQPVEED